MPKLTQKRLKELLHYGPETGLFTWRMSRGRTARAGQIAGCINGNGYRTIMIDGKDYLASRLAWLYREGYFPEHQVDHENRIRPDDRWSNLRHVSRVCNARNCNLSKNNKSGINGVCWHKGTQKWVAYIAIPDKFLHLGTFTSKLDAARARWQAEVKHGFPNCNTTSTAFLYLQNAEK